MLVAYANAPPISMSMGENQFLQALNAPYTSQAGFQDAALSTFRLQLASSSRFILHITVAERLDTACDSGESTSSSRTVR